MSENTETTEPEDAVQEPQDGPQEDDNASPNHEAAKYRRRLRETEALAESQLAEAMATRDAAIAELDEYKAKEVTAARDEMRAEVARKHGLSPEIIAGDSIEEMESWAEKISYYIPHPGYDPTAGQRPANGGSSWEAAFKASEE